MSRTGGAGGSREQRARDGGAAADAARTRRPRAGPRDPTGGGLFYRGLFDAVEVLPVDRRAAALGAAIARERQREGHTMQNTDALIAGCAAAAGAELLVTTDEDFAGIRAFEVELIRPT